MFSVLRGDEVVEQKSILPPSKNNTGSKKSAQQIFRKHFFTCFFKIKIFCFSFYFKLI